MRWRGHLRRAERALTRLVLATALATGPALGATLLPPGEQCFSATTGLNGMVGTTGTLTGGSGYVNGTYSGVPLTGGSGTGATATITVTGGAVTAVKILAPGKNYVVGDSLSAAAANLGGSGAGFGVLVGTIAVNSSLAGGVVNMYYPSTTTPKTTWRDPLGTTPNAVPIVLDGNGCAIIYGAGTYRQQLLDSVGNLIWDQLTADTSINSVHWAGLAGGTPNVVTLVDPGFAGVDGTIEQFVVLATNTSAVTINPSGFGLISVVKDTTSGPLGLSGGELIAGNVASVVYSATSGTFHLLNTAIASASGATAPLCGASGLKVVNSPGTPSTIINLTADQVVMQTPAGITINRSNVSVTINTSLGNATAAAGGMDGEAPGTSQWLNVWAIDNGAAPAGLANVQTGSPPGASVVLPTMPSGYTYKCRLGAVRVDGSGNLLRSLQLGARAQYQVQSAGNTTSIPIVVTGVAGTFNAAPTWSTQAMGSFVPPTATRVIGLLAEMSAASIAMVAPNANYGNYSSITNPPPVVTQSAGGANQNVNVTFELLLETSALFYVSNGASSILGVVGWVDKVNAN
jgi:hypothetical protein